MKRGSRSKPGRRRRLLNHLTIGERNEAAISAPRKSDFSDLVGHWTPDPSFEEVMAAQRKIDSKKWK